MTEQDEDSLHRLPNALSANAHEDDDLTDEVQDFRFLSNLSQYHFPSLPPLQTRFPPLQATILLPS